MPEGDSLVRVADRLRPVLTGQQLWRTDFRVPQLATTDLSGTTVGAVWPRAKYLVIDTGERPPHGTRTAGSCSARTSSAGHPSSQLPSGRRML